jgi:hypothetical protein
LLNPAERAELDAQGGPLLELSGLAYDDSDTSGIPGWNDVDMITPKEGEEAGIQGDDYDPTDVPDFDEANTLDLLTPEEREEYEQDKQVGKQQQQQQDQKKKTSMDPLQKYLDVPREELDPGVQENLKRIKTRLAQKSDKATFSPTPRPSIVSWLKDLKASEGTPIRGGK